jgi:hypothetical protein
MGSVAKKGLAPQDGAVIQNSTHSRCCSAILFAFALVQLDALSAPPDGAAFPRLDRINLLIYRNDNGEIAPVHSIADWQQRRAAILDGMQKVMGPLPGKAKRCALDPRIEKETDCGNFVRRFISYASEPGARVPAWLLIPKRALTNQIKVPAVLGLHQTHGQGQNVVVGLGDSPNDEYGVELAQRGYVVLAPPYPLLANYNPDLKALGYQSGTMKAIWDNIRGLDLLASLPFVKTNGFGAIGHSLGGHNAVFTAVFDDRLQVIVSSCGLDSFLDYMNGNIKGWTQERYMPKLLDYTLADVPFDFHEVIGALAPRLCFLSAPLGDTNFKWRSVDAVAEAARPIYQLYAQPSHLQVEHPDCGHLFPREMREKVYRLFDQQLR